MEDSDDYVTISSEDESKTTTEVNYLQTDGPSPKAKAKKQLRIDTNVKFKSRIQPKKIIKCDRDEEHLNPPWMNHYKPFYGPPLISSFLVIDIQKIFRSRFNVPVLNRITRSEGIELLGELLGMYDYENNIISYWTLDVLSQVIRKCQSISMKEDNVKMCILWIHYILYIIHKKRPKRKKLFQHLCIMFNRAMWQLPEMVVIPHPYHLKEEIDKQRSEKQKVAPPIISPKKMEKVSSSKISQAAEPRGFILEEEGILAEEFEGLEEDLFEGGPKEELEEESSSVEEEKSEDEEEILDNEDDISDFTMRGFKKGKYYDEEDPQLPDEANALSNDIKEKLHSLALELVEMRKENKRDFFLLIKIIYRIFANRFKFTVIWEAFANPPKPKIIGIGNNMRIPKKVKVRKFVPATKLTLKMRASAERKTKSNDTIKQSHMGIGSILKRFFPSIKKKPRKTRKKKSKHIRPLVEAVNPRFFEYIAGHKYKEIKYGEYKRRMEAIKKRLNLKYKDYDKMRDDLKVLLAKTKKKRNVGHKAKTGRGTMKTQWP